MPRPILIGTQFTGVALLAAAALLVGGCISGPGADDVARKIGALRGATRIGNETLDEPRTVWKFYAERRSRPAFRNRADDVVASIRGVEADGLSPADYHLEAIEALMGQKDRERTPESEAHLEVLLADAVAAIADHVHYGRVHPSSVNAAWNVDPRDDAPPLDSTLTAIAGASSVRSAIDTQRPRHFIYKGLVTALADLRTIQAQGGWPEVPAGKTLRIGASDRRVALVRRRLMVSGEYAGASAESTRFDSDLKRAVAEFQARHRIDTTGVVDARTLAAMNVSTAERLGQLRVNLERARWVLGGLGDDFLLVNLPAFKAYLIQGDRNVWESRTQIGQEAMQTPTFRATIRTVVFNPDWTVPPTILEKEILEDMKSGKDAIAGKGLVIYDRDNHPVDPSSIDWGSASAASFPYTIRQPAGDDNALGKVKFLFPNKYSIYLHDTPNRGLFEADRRTFSHGCIRIEHPLELAETLLRDQDHWDGAKIQDVLAKGETDNVSLEHPLPILIVYWTVSVGASGVVRYAEDIYDLDAPLLAALNRAAHTA